MTLFILKRTPLALLLLWARGYFVSTVGRDEETIRAYIRDQDLQDRQMDQLALIP